MDSSRRPAGAPPDIIDLARQRSDARTRREWELADDLRGRIEAAGWRVTDHGSRSSLSLKEPPTVLVNGEVRYGSASEVASVLNVAATTAWSVVVVASEEPAGLSGLLAGLRTHASIETQVVIVANDPSDAQAEALVPGAADLRPVAGARPEVIRTSVRLGMAAALNVGLRRASGELVLLADATAVPNGDALAPLASALRDPRVAAAGAPGLVPMDPDRPRLNRLRLSEGTGARQVAALDLQWLAFRRSDYRRLGPLDERFLTQAWLGAWWTVRLRADREVPSFEPGHPAEAMEEGTGSQMSAEIAAPEATRLAVRAALTMDLPLEGLGTTWPPDRTRMSRRNMYRVIHDFGGREDLA